MIRFLERLAAGWAVLGGVLVMAIMLVTSWNAGAFALDRIARLWGGTVAGLPGYEDFVRLTISCAALMFLPWCQAQRGHVAVDLFAGRFPLALQRSLGRFSLGLTALLAVFLGYWMTLGMLETRGDNAMSRVLGWPEWPFFLPGILSVLLWAAIALAQAIRAPLDGKTAHA